MTVNMGGKEVAMQAKKINNQQKLNKSRNTSERCFVDDQKNICKIKKNPYMTAQQVKNAL